MSEGRLAIFMFPRTLWQNQLNSFTHVLGGMDHIVYVDRPAGALDALRRGDKTMVGRAAMGRRMPYGKVSVGDTLYFTENDGKQIIHGRGTVMRVFDSPKLTHDESLAILGKHRKALWLSQKQFQNMSGKRYLVLVNIARYEEVPPFHFTRRAFHSIDDWLPVRDISIVRKDGPRQDLK